MKLKVQCTKCGKWYMVEPSSRICPNCIDEFRKEKLEKEREKKRRENEEFRRKSLLEEKERIVQEQYNIKCKNERQLKYEQEKVAFNDSVVNKIKNYVEYQKKAGLLVILFGLNIEHVIKLIQGNNVPIEQYSAEFQKIYSSFKTSYYNFIKSDDSINVLTLEQSAIIDGFITDEQFRNYRVNSNILVSADGIEDVKIYWYEEEELLKYQKSADLFFSNKVSNGIKIPTYINCALSCSDYEVIASRCEDLVMLYKKTIMFFNLEKDTTKKIYELSIFREDEKKLIHENSIELSEVKPIETINMKYLLDIIFEFEPVRYFLDGVFYERKRFKKLYIWTIYLSIPIAVIMELMLKGLLEWIELIVSSPLIMFKELMLYSFLVGLIPLWIVILIMHAYGALKK